MAPTRTESDVSLIAPAIITAELVEIDPARERHVPPNRADTTSTFAGLRRKLFKLVRAGGRVAEWLFGGIGIVVGLSILAAIPLLQFLSLGYLLEVAGRVGRTGRLRDGFIGYRQAARLTGIVGGIWIVLVPLRLTAATRRSALLIDPTSPAARGWGIALLVLTLLVAIHIVLALWRDGRMRHFLWPFFNPRKLWRQSFTANPYVTARDAVWDFVVGLRLPYYFWLGLRGFLGGLAWLVVPVSLLALGGRAPLASWMGALLLAWVLPALPFLQTHLAVEGRLGAMFERRTVRRLFTHAPLAFGFALLVTLLSALPLYLLKIEMLPREAAWLPSLVFVLFILPARLITGWAYGRGRRRPMHRHWTSRAAARLGMLDRKSVV